VVAHGRAHAGLRPQTGERLPALPPALGLDADAELGVHRQMRNMLVHYELDCECGNKLSVRETAAGAQELCSCGRTLIVPSLHELRSRAGLPAPGLSPEKVVETLLLAGKLPEEDHCVLCGVATTASICCTTECERASVVSGRPSWWVYLLGFLTFGWLGVAVARATAGDDREWGRDRIFPLPLRVCANCRDQLTRAADLKAALSRVPVYRRLLEKYPNARVSLSSWASLQKREE
jgi:hypothetical protein